MLVEYVNEESALFGGSLGQLQRSKTLRERMGTKFAEWLERYGSEAAVLERWGEGGLDAFSGHEKMPEESFANKQVYPVGGPWYWHPDQINNAQTLKHRAY